MLIRLQLLTESRVIAVPAVSSERTSRKRPCSAAARSLADGSVVVDASRINLQEQEQRKTLKPAQAQLTHVSLGRVSSIAEIQNRF